MQRNRRQATQDTHKARTSRPDFIDIMNRQNSKISPWRNPLASFRRVLWRAGFIFLLCGPPFVRADLLPNNFLTNSTFELGSNLDQTDGTVSNWDRGGNDPTICQVITNNFVSSGHSLAVIDANAGDYYGEWYSDVLLDGHASGGDTLNIQWYEMYNLDGPEMRLTVLFFNASDPDHPINRGTLCPKGASLEQDILNDRRLLKPQVRRPGSEHWEDISWDDAIGEIAQRVKKTRDETFIEKDAAGHTVNRLESVAFTGGCTDTNEFNYLVVKTMRSLGVVHLENQARV